MWKNYLKMVVVKNDYNRKREERDRLPFFQRILAFLKEGSLKDPYKGLSFDHFWSAFQKAFPVIPLQKLEPQDTGRTISKLVTFSSEGLPVLKITFFDGQVAYQERKIFHRDGTVEELGVAYPVSEFGITGLPEPVDNDIRLYVEAFRREVEEIREVITSIPE